MYKYPHIEQFYKDNFTKLLDWSSPLRPSKSCPKNGVAGVAKFTEFYQRTKVSSFGEKDVHSILNDDSIEDGDTIFHQNLRVMRELNFVQTNSDYETKYTFTEQFISFVESGHTIDCYIIEQLMSIASIEDFTMYFNFLICVMREAAIFGQVIQYRDSVAKFMQDVPDPQRRKEHQDRIFSVYGFKGDQARGITNNYTPNISYFCHAILRQLGILAKSDVKIDNMGTLVLTPLGEVILKKIEENLQFGKQALRPQNYNIIHLGKVLDFPLQQIFYGAPGTGKSHKTNEVVSCYPNTVRTTFHPDSDYSTFVGAYKPTMEEVDVKTVPVVVSGGITLEQNKGTYKEKRISYKFVKQAFLKAYVKAWKHFKATCKDGNPLAPQFLVIEEINRGNCAQIFGDLFQLLDRKNGFSEYPVEADEDIHKALLDDDSDENPSFGKEGLQLDDDQKAYINKRFNNQPVADKICNGQVLVLPPNLYIWATMNTSDQSLFPIDAAFKRRWDWKYMKIKEGKDDNGNKLDWKIIIKDKEGNAKMINGEDSLSWWAFIQKVNEIIASMTSSADKQLGYFFCKANEEGVISGELFVGKVIFYLWNDVFKDYGFEDASLFRYEVEDNGRKIEKDLAFPDFYDEDGETINADRLVDFIEKVMAWQRSEDNA